MRPYTSLSIKGMVVSLLMVFAFFIPRAAAQMRQLYKDLNEDNSIRKISFYSPSQGYVAFRDWIGFTSDSGRTFVKKYVTLTNVDFNGYNVNITFGFGINGVKAFNQHTIIAYGDYGLVPAILYSTNGGNTFELIYHSQFSGAQLHTGIMDMVFPENNVVGYAVDADRVLKTTDGGQSWFTARSEAGAMFEHLEAIDNNTVFAFSGGYATSKLLRTTNGGTAWSQVALPPGTLNCACFNTASKGWVNMNDIGGKIYYTTTGGSSWVQQNNELASFTFEKMKFVNESTGYAIGAAYNTYKTTDSGRIWERLPRSHPFTYLGYAHKDLQYFSNMQLWAGGDYGLLELGLNGGGMPIPAAYFMADTIGLWIDNTVQLRNYSKQGYQYAWYKNGVLISTAYHASYVHDIYKLKDTIQLVVSNGTYADTAVHYPEFYPPVIINEFSPVTAGGGATITLKGINFTSAVAVSFGGEAASFSVVSDSVITARVSTSGASGDVMVITPYGSGRKAGFTFIPAPVITSFAPASATAGTPITITGDHFTGATAVQFGGVPVTSFTVVSPTTIRAIPGAGSSGNVTVTTPGGISTMAGFTMIPIMSSFSPASGTIGEIVTIKGSGLTGVTGVSFGGVPAQSFTIDSLTGITAVVGAGGTGNVMITSPGGNASLPGFRFFLPPVITSFAPASGPVGSSVTITGVRFSSVADSNIVYFGAARATVTAASATSLTVTVPAGATYQPLSLTVNHLTAYSQQAFAVTFADGGSITDSSFSAKTTFPAGNGVAAPVKVTLADFDLDGKNDLVVVNAATRSVSVWHNTGSGNNTSFSRSDYVTGEDVSNVSVTDLDGDGRLDIAIGRGTWPVDAPSVYRNTSTPGNVSFEATAGRYGLNVLAADVDLDGKPDLIGTNGVYRNTSSAGNISFAAVAPHNVGGSTVVVKDLDLDGKPDIISLHVSDNMLTIGRNTSTVGHISFAASAALGVTRPYDVTAGDLDGDNKPDIAVASDDYGTLSVFRNTSTTGTIAFAARGDIQTGYVSLDIAMHDLDGDGKADVVLTHPFEDEFSVYKNTSNIGSVSFASAVYYSIDGYPGGLAAGDVTGDGKPDIVIVNGVVSGISVYNNRVSPAPFISSFTPATGAAGTIVTINGHNFNGITGVSFGGVNAASFTVNSPVSITAVVGTGAAGSVAVTNVYGTATKAGFAYGLPPVISSISPASAVAGASVTISGAHFSTSAQSNIVAFGGVRANVLSASANSLVVTVPPGSVYRPVSVTVNSLSAYTEQPFITTFPGADSAFTAASFGAKAEFEGRGMGSIADVDGDGKLDMVFPSGDKVIAVSRNTSKPGSLSFASKIVFPGPDEFYELAPVDMDGDGKQDIIVSTEGAQLSILRNISTGGNPAFAPKVDFKVDGAMGFATGDLDQDGKPDLVVVNYAGAISLFRNISRNGVIAIDRRVNYTMPSPRAVALGDFDNDGRPDIVVAMNSSIAVYRNTSTVGAISFTPVWNMPVTSPTRLYTPDIDGDGKTDIVVNLRFTKEVIVFRNSSASANISFAAKQSFAIGDDAYYITIADLDGDNKPDIVANNRDNNTISILKNTATPGTIAMLAKTDYAVPDGLNTSTNGDMDGDGKPDLITFHGTNQLFIWRNQMDRSVLVSYCAGSDTSLTATVSGSTYKWQQNTGGGFVDVTNNVHLSGANTATLHLSDIPADWNGYQYRCIVNGKTDIISLLHLESEALPVAGITASERTICAGTPVTFTATADNAGTAPAWQWLINGKAITGANNNVFTSDTLRNGAMVSAVVSSNTFCKRGIKDTSNIITMEVTAPVVFTGKATAPARSYIDNPFLITFKGNNVPAGAIVEVWESIDSSPFAEIGDYYYKGDTLYRWMRDNPSVGVKRYFFHMKPVTDTNCFKAANSDTVTVVIAAPGPPTIVEVCTGADTTLTSSRTGTSYKWQIRSVGSPFYDVSDDNIFSGGKTAVLHVSNIPAVWDNYQFRCIVDGVSSDTFALKVLPDVSPAITIAVAANPVCAGSQVTFTTAVVNAGASPEYKWQLNGLPAGPDSNTYTTDDLADGDKVSAIITSHERCVIAPADTSNTIVMSVERLDKPAVAQSNLALSITNFDITVAYRWQQLDSATVWVDVVPAETDTSYLALKKGSYRVRATKGICTAYSDQLTVLITGLEPVVNNTSGIHLYPNPVVNSLTLDALKLSDKWETLDILGIGASQSLATYNISGRTKVTINVSRLNYGYYIAVLKRKNGPPAAIRFIKM